MTYQHKNIIKIRPNIHECVCQHNTKNQIVSQLCYKLIIILFKNFLIILNIGAIIYWILFSIQVNQTSVKPMHDRISSDEPEYLQKVKMMTQCYDKSNDFKIVNHGDFWIFKNFVRATDGPIKCHQSVTLTVQGDFTFLDNLEILVERWRAPISLALYTPGYDFLNTMESVLFLRNCVGGSELIKQYVTFHFFFDRNHTYKNVSCVVISLECIQISLTQFFSAGD